jgi:hypothetical protein
MPDDAEVGRMVGEVAISYTVKELLARIEDRQIRLDERIGQLATTAEVSDLRAIVDRHEARWNRVLGAAIAVATLSGGAAGWTTTLLTGG